MTLLEAIVAMVILALAGVGCLELAHGAAQLQSSSVEWDDAINEAESRMASVLVSARVNMHAVPASMRDRAGTHRNTTVSRRPWRNGLDEVAVTVAIDSARVFTLRRLVPSRSVR